MVYNHLIDYIKLKAKKNFKEAREQKIQSLKQKFFTPKILALFQKKVGAKKLSTLSVHRSSNLITEKLFQTLFTP